MNDNHLRDIIQSYLNTENWFEAWRYSSRIENKTAEDYFYMAVSCNGLKNVPMALYYLRKARDLSEKYLHLYEEAVKEIGRPEKLAILCLPGLDSFIKDIYEVFKNIFETKLVISNNAEQIKQAYDWADIVWIEWGNDLAVFVTNNFEKKGKKIVCRIHSYEVFAGFPLKINWDKVDKLIFVANHIREEFFHKYPEIGSKLLNKIMIVSNGLNLNKFVFKERQKGRKIATVALIRHTKNPQMWLQVLKTLLRKDPKYELHIAGNFQDVECEYYMRNYIQTFHLEQNVFFYGYINNVNEFLRDKNFILSTSIREGHPYNIMEALASGIKPIIGYYPGVFEQFPKELIFSDFEDVVNIVEGEYESEKYRRFVEDNYSLEKQMLAFYEILLEDFDRRKTSNSNVISENQHPQKSGQTAVMINFPKDTDSFLKYLKGIIFSNSLFINYSMQSALRTRIDYLKELAKDKIILHIGFADHKEIIRRKIEQKTWLHGILLEFSKECWGIDINEEAVNFVKKDLEIKNVFCLDIEKDELPDAFLNKEFDYVLLGEVIEHIGNPVLFLSSIRNKFLGKAKQIVLTTPNAFRIVNLHYARQNVEIINSDHRFYFTPYTICKVLTDAGYEIKMLDFVESYPPPAENVNLLAANPLVRDTLLVIAQF